MSATPQKSNWYIIYTRPKYEKKIFSELLKKDVETFLPLQKVIRQWKDRKKRFEIPLFPNYLFVRISIFSKWKVSKINGVVRFLKSEGQLSTISDTEIEAIRISLLGNPVVSTEIYSKGDKVIINSGPIRGLRGTLVDQRGKKRLLIKISAINRNIIVNVPPNNVQKLFPTC